MGKVDSMITAVRNAATMDDMVAVLREGSDSAPASSHDGAITLYHGTSRGNTFNRFDASRAGSGVGKNSADQGDQIYLTANLQAAEWFAEKAEIVSHLMDGGIPGLRDDNSGTVLKFTLEAGAQVLQKMAMPRGAGSREVIQQAKEAGYDAISFPDTGFLTVEGDPRVTDLLDPLGAPPTTYIILNEAKLTAAGEAGGSSDADNLLSTYTEADLAERERQQQAARDDEQRQREEDARRAQADRDRDDFRLSGSDSASDVAASYGQDDMLGATSPPPNPEAAEALAAVAAETDPDPSRSQIEAGNYRKGRITIQGLDIAIENAKGSTRRGTDDDGNQWESHMAHHYGDIKGTTGADGDNLDVFIGDNTESQTVYVIDQNAPGGGFDEHKVMLGFTSEADARAAYLANYEAGWKGLGGITSASMDGFKKWAREGDTRRPFAQHLDTDTRPADGVAQDDPGEFPGPQGKEMQVKTAKGTKVDTRFTVLEAEDLVASHTPAGRENAAFPQELQPRDRSRDSSRAWIQKTAKDLDPGLLGKTKKADSGAPIIGKDRVVESGNGRTLAIMEAYRLGTADEYKQWLVEDAESYGLNPTQIAGMKAPVLVRVRAGKIDRASFAVEANQDDKLAMTATEKAKADASRLTPELMGRFDPGADGDMLVASNRDFIMGFLQSLGDAESAQYLTSTGEFTGPLIARVQAAVFAKAYEDERLLELMADSAKPENRNIISALSAAAPAFIQARSANEEGTQAASTQLADSVEMSLDNEAVKSLIDATNIVRQAKREGMDVGEYVSQMGLFGDVDPGVAAMAVFIAQNNRSAKRLSTAFKAMAEFVQAELERNNAAAGDIFGEAATVSMADVVEAANRVMEREYGEGSYRIDTPASGGLFESVERIRRQALREYLVA